MEILKHCVITSYRSASDAMQMAHYKLTIIIIIIEAYYKETGFSFVKTNGVLFPC